eukprot:TRINITY_DN9608_c0_g1_i1.p1 TRINITY_DN9608_c0_g1~~TRINITY_DN9608_c0_g1_i1.p1  ORF type:complete len:302 (-),score=69.30 TRINITY_DN9608_c0_g1_i1:379-1284(-)
MEAKQDEAEAYTKIDQLLCEIATEADPVKQQELQQGVSRMAASLPPPDTPKGNPVRQHLPTIVLALVAAAALGYSRFEVWALQGVVEEQKRELDLNKWGSSMASTGSYDGISMCWPWEWPWQLHIVSSMFLLVGWLMLRAVLSRGGIKHGAPVKGKWCPQVEGDFLVLMIGIVPHSLWAFWRWMPIVRGMVNMSKDLQTNADSGFLGYEVYVGLQPMIVQYWRSFDHMKKCPAPEWASLAQSATGDSSLGVWHETYVIKAGDYEGVYSNMPPYGLGKVGKCVEAKGQFEKAASRLELNKSR